jgi:hypothetical protein
MIYEFQAEDGSIVERDYPMAQAPQLGQAITVDGKKYKRILSAGSQQVIKEFKEYESVACPKGVEKIDPSIKVNPKTGRPIITNRAQEREIARQTGQEWL